MNYTKELLKHFQNPKFVKSLENPDGVGEVGNINCGDVMHLEIKVEHPRAYNRKGCENPQAGPETFSKKGLQGAKIKDIGFKTFGCAAAVASSDVVCELAKGKTIEEAKKITKDDIIKKLGGMPPIKIHCSVLGIEALKRAILDYEEKKVKHSTDSPKRGRTKEIEDWEGKKK